MKMSESNYFMNIALACSLRSADINSKHGCVAVSKDGNILSTGYNGPPRKVDDAKIPLTRPEKYLYFEHSERNCIYNAARVGTALKGCIFYVTGIPCVDCMRAMYQVGASEVVYLDKNECKSTDDSWYDFMDYIKQYMKVTVI